MHTNGYVKTLHIKGFQKQEP